MNSSGIPHPGVPPNFVIAPKSNGRIFPISMPILPDDSGPRDSMCALLDRFFEALDRQRQLLSAGDKDGADRAFHRGVDLVREMVHAIDHHPPDSTNK